MTSKSPDQIPLDPNRPLQMDVCLCLISKAFDIKDSNSGFLMVLTIGRFFLLRDTRLQTVFYSQLPYLNSGKRAHGILLGDGAVALGESKTNFLGAYRPVLVQDEENHLRNGLFIKLALSGPKLCLKHLKCPCQSKSFFLRHSKAICRKISLKAFSMLS